VVLIEPVQRMRFVDISTASEDSQTTVHTSRWLGTALSRAFGPLRSLPIPDSLRDTLVRDLPRLHHELAIFHAVRNTEIGAPLRQTMAGDSGRYYLLVVLEGQRLSKSAMEERATASASTAMLASAVFGVFAGVGVGLATSPRQEELWLTVTLLDKTRDQVLFHDRVNASRWPGDSTVVEEQVHEAVERYFR
jgi:hypothetical protein